MPIFTGAIFTWSPSSRKTTSTGLAASLDFLSPLPRFVAIAIGVLVGFLVWAVAELVAEPLMELVFEPSLGRRVVMLAIGTASTLVRERVSISAVTDMPGRKISF